MNKENLSWSFHILKTLWSRQIYILQDLAIVSKRRGSVKQLNFLRIWIKGVFVTDYGKEQHQIYLSIFRWLIPHQMEYSKYVFAVFSIDPLYKILGKMKIYIVLKLWLFSKHSVWPTHLTIIFASISSLKNIFPFVKLEQKRKNFNP